jgi:hypothetical protein
VEAVAVAGHPGSVVPSRGALRPVGINQVRLPVLTGSVGPVTVQTASYPAGWTSVTTLNDTSPDPR